MIKRFVIFTILVVVAIALWLVNAQYPTVIIFWDGFLTVALFAGLYLLFKIIFEELIVERLATGRTRYSLRKVLSLVFLTVFVAGALGIWLENVLAVVVAYGLIGAGFAIALQDIFKNIAGSFMVFFNRLYRVGDRIEINDQLGDVVDIGLLYTTLLEIQGWVDGDQASGRLVSVPNGAVLNRPVHNYTQDHEFVWEEMMLPITYESDWQKAHDIVLDIVHEETKQAIEGAREALLRLRRRYYIDERANEPSIYVSLTDNWIQFGIRYIAPARERREVFANISKRVLSELRDLENIEIASESIIISGVPELRMRDVGK